MCVVCVVSCIVGLTAVWQTAVREHRNTCVLLLQYVLVTGEVAVVVAAAAAIVGVMVVVGEQSITMSVFVCFSVFLSVSLCLSQVGVLLKRVNESR